MNMRSAEKLEAVFQHVAADINFLLKYEEKTSERDEAIQELFVEIQDLEGELKEHGYEYAPWLEEIYYKLRKRGVLK